MKEKRKRAPGGGRKPGEFGLLGEVVGVRLPKDLKAQLRQAAEEGDRSLSAEVVRRLRLTFGYGRRVPDQSQSQRYYYLVHTALNTIAEEVTASAERVTQAIRLAQQDSLKPPKRGGKR